MTENTKIDFIYLPEQDMIRAGVTDMAGCVDAMEEMFAPMYRGDYRMPGANNDSHGAAVLFAENMPFPDMPNPPPTAVSWRCLPIWADVSARPG